jgi:hypothetical protein
MHHTPPVALAMHGSALVAHDVLLDVESALLLASLLYFSTMPGL